MAVHKDKDSLSSSTLRTGLAGRSDDQRQDSKDTVSTAINTPVASPREAALYVGDMLEALENLAIRSNLNVLALMLAMARDQADDDAGKLETTRAQAAG